MASAPANSSADATPRPWLETSASSASSAGSSIRRMVPGLHATVHGIDQHRRIHALQVWNQPGSGSIQCDDVHLAGQLTGQTASLQRLHDAPSSLIVARRRTHSEDDHACHKRSVRSFRKCVAHEMQGS